MRKRSLAMILALLAVILPVHMALAQSEGASSTATDASQPGLLSPVVTQAIWVLVIFVVLVFVLYKTAWKNVLAGLNAREQRIRGDIAAAEQARVKAEQSLKDYQAQLAVAQDQVRGMIAQASADAEKIAANIRLQAQADAAAERQRATAEIDQAKRDAIRQVYEQTAEISTSIASKIIRRNLNPQDQQDLVNQALGQFQNV